MQINSVSGQNFGKIIIDSTLKKDDVLLEQTAFGIGYENANIFTEKFRMCNDTELGEKCDIFVNTDGVKVQAKDSTGFAKDFSTDKYPEDTPNLLYHLLHAAMNYVILKDKNIIK